MWALQIVSGESPMSYSHHVPWRCVQIFAVV